MAAPPPTVPADFAQELAELRACVQQLQRENTDLINCNSKVNAAKNGKRTSEKFVKFDTRFGTSTPQSRSRRGLHGAECGSVSRIVRVVCPDGEGDRQRRGQCALEPFQPTVNLTAYRSARARARYGLRGVRVGDPPGPRRVTPQREFRYIAVSKSFHGKGKCRGSCLCCCLPRELRKPAQWLIGWPQSQGPCTKMSNSMKVWPILPMRFELVLQV